MIFFTNRGYETLAVASADTEKGLKLLDDELNQTIKTGTAIYNAKIAKNDKSVEKIEAGSFVFVPNFKNKMIPLEVMDVYEERSYKKIIAEDAGLELLNSDVGDHKMKGTLREHILATIGKDSDWTIGIDEIGDSRNLTLEYTGVSNQTKRIVQIAGRFGAEISYSFIFDGNEIKEKRINFVKERGEDKAVRLEVGKELKDVKRNISITNLRTAVLGVGKPHKETIKTTKTVKKTVNVNDSSTTTKHTNGKLDPFINWFQARKGRVRYSMYSRMGPSSYDCSSSVHFAAKHAGLLPSNHYIGSTETLFGMKGKYLDEISRADIRYGDIFVAGRQGASGGAGGHTGAVLDKNRIIHCNYGSNGIAITPINGYTGGPPVRWFRWRNSGYGSQTVSNRRYWTNSNVIYHNLGFNLGGLSAGQLNNWIRATSPSSPFNGQGNVFMEAQKQSGLDARYILAHAALESAWGRSNIAKRYNNYFGIGAFDNDPNNAKNFSNSGLASGIINGAKWIAKNYYNSSYKQTTLYKMRNNNGVHQYATDPNWHNKIANIMKGSERYTSPSGPNSTKTVTQTVTESKEVDKDTNLKGYKYDDGRFFVDKDGRVCDREANAIWAKPNTKGKYLSRIYESEATSQKTLFDECLSQLKKNNQPEVSYDVNPNKIPKDIDVGDRVRIIDHDYSPALYLEARLVDVTTSSTNDYINSAVFANFVPKTSGIAERLLNLQANVQEFKYSFENQPYVMSLESSSGNVFKDDIVDTNLIAKLTKAGIDQSANVDGYIWERISKYPDKLVIKDEEWNENHKELNEHFIELSRSDIELEATFVCSAMLDDLAVATASYTIKNLSIGIYKQKEEPDRNLLMWGDVWQWEEGKTKFKRIWKGDRWEDTVTKRDLELLELTPGPPGQDGKDGMPGKAGADGKTSYMHFAYADSKDGVVGFTLTATSGKKYIGFYTDFVKADSKDPKKYEWSKYVGDDGKPGKDGVNGIPGKAGADGKTPYFHTAWANSSDGSKDFSTSQAGEKLYIGTYTDYAKEDSRDPKKYTWQLVKGNTGPKGVDGKDGHVLTVEAWLEGEFRNYKTKNVKRIIQAKYDGEDIELDNSNTEVYNCYGNGEWSRAALSDFWADWDRQYEYIANKVVVSYKGLKAEAYARLDNIKDGEKGEPGKQGIPGKNGADGKDGKTGKIGQNLLRNSNVPVENKDYNTNEWTLCETPTTGETMTFTAKVKLEKDDKLMVYNSGGMIRLNWWTEVKSGDYVIYSSTFNWRDKIEYNGKTYEQTNPPTLIFYAHSNGNGNNKNNNTVSIEWATLTRGDIPAIEWSPCYADTDDAISEKASEESLQDLQVHFAMYPTAEELNQNKIDLMKQQAYLDQLKTAIDSNALSLEDRLSIIEANVGAGKLSLEAINTYLHFGEEGVLIGKEGEQVRLRLINNALEITDGTKVVARFANNQTETPNLKVTGAFEFGYHVASKVDLDGNKFTVISSNI
jgi:phage minor structural protein